MSKMYSNISSSDSAFKPIVTQAIILAVFTLEGRGSPVNLAIAFAFRTIVKAIIAGIKLINQTRKKAGNETIANISAV
jgi:hypothetical protein